ncbi:hypothetical protein FRC18_006338 [Serendipita sp. 400]|nr:hypothetical protein FRC18_006338 [Serendipita sp. 400]
MGDTGSAGFIKKKEVEVDRPYAKRGASQMGSKRSDGFVKEGDIEVDGPYAEAGNLLDGRSREQWQAQQRGTSRSMDLMQSQ